MSSIKELVAIGTEMKLEGEALAKFVREEQARERDEREREQEERQRERERDDKLQEAARLHELELIKEKRESVEKEVRFQLELEKDREERAIRDHQRKLELLAVEKKPSTSDLEGNAKPSVRGPKLPPFEQDKDNIDSYIRRFEQYASAQKWEKSNWATNLGALLKGRALDVYTRLPVEQSFDFDILKTALLKRFEMTEEGYRNRFHTCRPESGESFTQFGVRLDSYIERWREMSNTAKIYEGLKDLIVRDQFLQSFAPELVLWLKERSTKLLGEIAKFADQYSEARGNKGSLVKHKNAGKNPSHGPKREQSDTPESSSSANANVKDKEKKKPRQCFICRSTDHIAYNCPKKSGTNRVSMVTGTDQHRHRARNRKKKPDTLEYDEVVVDREMSDEVHKTDQSQGRMPVVEGLVGRQVVTVLRDTGCSGVVLKQSLATQDQLTGDTKTCTLADGSLLQVPIAKVMVDTPYYVGSVDAWCMQNSIYELILGNIEGARAPDDPYLGWNYGEELVVAVKTRVQI
ncbi:histone-lysine N-methyltransferase, H3 lysine-79 specific-like [Ylistrum balloti]|uniref:histone-lysine N-methyltransferase, H3 lysine-79 specific-like n=1 Tax=Ylistrum balloti TaxID=509963 RepID=UPI002905A4CA|nr:histone-lysine N-methyltransferase, H3 lysine-79 specific-like [Ylistrum balloti]